MDFDLDGYLEAMRRKEQIRCPHCDSLQEDNCDGKNYPVHFWGHEDGPEKMECQSCEAEFFVEERVRRTYKVGETAEEARE